MTEALPTHGQTMFCNVFVSFLFFCFLLFCCVVLLRGLGVQCSRLVLASGLGIWSWHLVLASGLGVC